MSDPILFAIPAFVILLIVEILSFRYLPDDEEAGYERRDTVTSLSMGFGYLGVAVFWKLALLAIYMGLYELTPLRLSPSNAWTWVALVFADDFAYYWHHRAHHRVRVLWASHVVHHSSRYYNFGTALRQTWTPMTGLPFWLFLPLLGFPPWMVLAEQSISMVYQFWLHTERVGKLPPPFEFVLNTPSHHRVHHGSNDVYLDRDYGGILIIFDRLFGTFQPEREPVSYGLTKNISTFNPVRVAFGEFAALGRDMRSAPRARDALGYAAMGPGWTPPPPPVTGPAPGAAPA